MTDQPEKRQDAEDTSEYHMKFGPGEIPIVPEGWMELRTFEGTTHVVKGQTDEDE